MMKIRFFLFAILGTIFISDLAQAKSDFFTKKFVICEEDNDWPPFMFNNKKTKKFDGFTIEVINKIFSKHKIAYSLELAPLVRCLSEVEKGEKDIVLDIYFDSKRAEKFIYSESYYQLSSAYFYSKKRFPEGLKIANKSELKKYKGCGIQGYTYEHFDLTDKDIVTGAKDQRAAISMVIAGRCDYFVEELEIMKGYKLTENDILSNPEIVYSNISDVVSPKLFFLFSKKNRDTPKLKALIDNEFKLMEKNGEFAKIMKKYN